MIDRTLEIYKRVKRGAAILGAVAVAGTTSVLPIGEPSVVYANNSNSENSRTMSVNSANCLPLGVALNGGSIRAGFALSAERFYTLYEGSTPVKDITSELIGQPGAFTYNDFDWDGNKVGEVSRVSAYFSDYRISLEGGEQSQIMRARYGENELQTRAYRLEQVNGSWENTGNVLTFSKDKPDGQIEIQNLCGQTETRDAIKVEKWRLLKDNALRRVKNAVVWLARDCILYDQMESDHYLRPQDKPAQPVVEAPVPARRVVPVPVQIPSTGDGSTEAPDLRNMPNIKPWPGQTR